MKIKNIITSILAVVFFASCDKIDENEFPEVISNSSKIEKFTAFNVIEGDTILVDALIDTEQNNITAILPPLYDIKDITPLIKISRGAVVVPESEAVQDFSNPVEYTVTSRSGDSTTVYSTNITIAGIMSFNIEGVDIPIDHNKRTIKYFFEADNNPILNIRDVKPVITVSEGAVIAPASGESVDFSSPVTYTLTTPEGAVLEYTVTIGTEGIKDYFDTFETDWTTVNMVFEKTAEGTLIKRDGGFAHEAGAYSNILNAEGDYVVEAKLRFLSHAHAWATAGFFINGSLEGQDPVLVFGLMADATNMIGIHKARPAGWQAEHAVVEGMNSEDWTLLRIEKVGSLVQFFVNDEVFGDPITFENLEGNIGLMGEFSEAEYEYISYRQL